MGYWLKLNSFFAALLLLPIWAGAESRELERIVAVVNGKPILLSDLSEAANRFREELKKRNSKESPGTDSEVQKRVLDQLINNQLVASELERRGLSANDSAIDSAVASSMQDNGIKTTADLRTALKAEGLTLEEYRASLKQQIENFRLMSSVIRPRVQITDQDIEAAYRRQQNSEPAQYQYRVRMIMKKKTDAQTRKTMEKLRKEVGAGIPFERIANRETEGPGKGEGGSIGLVSPSDLQPELAKEIKKLKPKEVSPVISTSQGLYLLECVEQVRAPSRGLNDMRSELRTDLTKTETERQFDAFVRGLRDGAQIQILL